MRITVFLGMLQIRHTVQWRVEVNKINKNKKQKIFFLLFLLVYTYVYTMLFFIYWKKIINNHIYYHNLKIISMPISKHFQTKTKNIINKSCFIFIFFNHYLIFLLLKNRFSFESELKCLKNSNVKILRMDKDYFVVTANKSWNENWILLKCDKYQNKLYILVLKF